MRRGITCGMAASWLILSAGLAMAWDSPAPIANVVQNEPVFARAGAILGKTVHNSQGDEIGSIDDLIFDRGSGRIEHVLLKSGAVLGIGGKTIAVNADRLSHDAEDRAIIDMTESEVEAAAPFEPEQWSQLDHQTAGEAIDAWWDNLTQDDEPLDPYSDSMTDAERKTISGTISSIERWDTVDGGEEMRLVVETDDGDDKTLVLGPSWFVTGGEASPERGDRIEAEALVLPRDDQNRLIVVNATIDGKTFEARADDGHALWLDDDRADGRGRLMLVSDLIGAPARTRDEGGGEVQNVILETNSKRIAFIGFDRNDNAFGLGDEIKVVPWSIARVRPDRSVLIDASKEMVLAAPEMPDEAADLATTYASAYDPYDIPADAFEGRGLARNDHDMHWGDDGELVAMFRSAPRATVSGRVADFQSVVLVRGSAPARIVVLDTDDGERYVVLGPAAYFEEKPIVFRQGDDIVVKGKRTTIDGREYVAAYSVDGRGRTLTLWESDEPVWDDR